MGVKISLEFSGGKEVLRNGSTDERAMIGNGNHWTVGCVWGYGSVLLDSWRMIHVFVFWYQGGRGL